MKLGIDFGTSHTVVATADQGNYPVVSFSSLDGDWLDHYPTLVAIRDSEILYGFEALALVDNSEWIVIRSIKSLLKNDDPNRTLTLSGKEYSIQKLLIGLLKRFRSDLMYNSNISINKDSLRVSIALPAQTNNTQRFLTAECFIAAGFDVVQIFNEPSAVTMEYARSSFKQIDRSPKKFVLIYDLGGGTFDASIAEIHDTYHRIVTTEGISGLGGDQFDELLAALVKEQIPSARKLEYGDEVRLLEICREKKEALTPHSQIILLEWAPKGAEPVLFRISVKDYYERCKPLLRATVKVLDRIISKVTNIETLEAFSSIYLVGGMSNFPLINRELKKIYGNHRVKKSQYCVSAVAIGLANLMDRSSKNNYQHSETWHFGLWREGFSGQSIEFDPVFTMERSNNGIKTEKTQFRRRYNPAHNIGVFRFQECSRLDEGIPSGLVTVWDRIYFPFDEKQEGKDLKSQKIVRYDKPLSCEIEEIYTAKENGEISVELINHQSGYKKIFHLSPLNQTITE